MLATSSSPSPQRSSWRPARSICTPASPAPAPGTALVNRIDTRSGQISSFLHNGWLKDADTKADARCEQGRQGRRSGTGNSPGAVCDRRRADAVPLAVGAGPGARRLSQSPRARMDPGPRGRDPGVGRQLQCPLAHLARPRDGRRGLGPRLPRSGRARRPHLRCADHGGIGRWHARLAPRPARSRRALAAVLDAVRIQRRSVLGLCQLPVCGRRLPARVQRLDRHAPLAHRRPAGAVFARCQPAVLAASVCLWPLRLVDGGL